GHSAAVDLLRMRTPRCADPPTRTPVRRFSMYRLVIACALALLVALAGTALTATPDGHPPSTETSCTGLSGSARGLCNAYCQAQDCDVHPRPSCEQLRKNFQRATGSSKFPCDRVACGQ